MLKNSLIILISVIAMEAFAWFSHKYIMHGIMWHWHISHHEKHKNKFEKNDLFGLIFGSISALFLIIGSEISQLNFIAYIGIGIALYGIFYFIFHDIIVHKRIKIDFNIKNTYLKRIIKAHHIHHKTTSKLGAEAFGFLYASKKYSSKSKLK